jgi:hypothetical protein
VHIRRNLFAAGAEHDRCRGAQKLDEALKFHRAADNNVPSPHARVEIIAKHISGLPWRAYEDHCETRRIAFLTCSEKAKSAPNLAHCPKGSAKVQFLV